MITDSASGLSSVMREKPRAPYPGGWVKHIATHSSSNEMPSISSRLGPAWDHRAARELRPELLRGPHPERSFQVGRFWARARTLRRHWGM